MTSLIDYRSDLTATPGGAVGLRIREAAVRDITPPINGAGEDRTHAES
jgi:hypothetical protein